MTRAMRSADNTLRNRLELLSAMMLKKFGDARLRSEFVLSIPRFAFRAANVQLTKKGERFLEKMAKAHRGGIEEPCDGSSPAQIGNLRNQLAQLNSHGPCGKEGIAA